MTEYKDILIISSLGLNLLLGFIVLGIIITQRKFYRKWRAISEMANMGGIEEHLQENNKQAKELLSKVDDLVSKTLVLESKMDVSLRFFGLERFDAFDDVGGKQSFALAIHDQKGDGMLITSICGRQDCKVYAKKIESGKSERELLPEEQTALKQASGKITVGV